MKAYTDIEQSKKLAEILPIESADMRYDYMAPYEYSDRMFNGGYDEVPYPKDFLKRNPNFSQNEYDGEFPCWSLAALLELIPCADIVKLDTTWTCGSILGRCEADNPVDACYEMIIKLSEQKLL